MCTKPKARDTLTAVTTVNIFGYHLDHLDASQDDDPSRRAMCLGNRLDGPSKLSVDMRNIT